MNRDENLRQYATDDQWKKLEAYWAEGSDRRAGAALGCAYSRVSRARAAVLKRAARAGYSPQHDMTRPVPDGFFLKGTSTLYDRNGQISAQWVKSSADQDRQQELFREAVEAFASDLPRVTLTTPPQHQSNSLLAAYPIGDHHTGMYAYRREALEDYDLNIAERLLCGAIDHLVATTPKTEQALIAFLGDYLHYDGVIPVTPSSGHPLDADGRFSKMVSAAIRMVRYVIAAALAKHPKVHIIVETGNHDIASSVFLREAIAALYENEPRIYVDTSPRLYHYYRWGKTLIGTHHGHQAKLAQLPLIMATDQPEAWGATTHRTWWTGHIHQDRVLDVQGCRVESFRVLPPGDAWAVGKGYRGQRSMTAIVLHQEHGEVARHLVNPAMLE